MKARGAGNERGGGEKEIEAREKVKEKVREREREALTLLWEMGMGCFIASLSGLVKLSSVW